MNPPMIGTAQAYMATSPHGRREPLVVTVYDTASGGAVPAVPVPEQAVHTLEQVMRNTGYPDFISFLVLEPYLEFMEARAGYVMDALFEQENHILLIRCDSPHSAKAFLVAVSRNYELAAMQRPRAAAATRTSVAARR